MNNEVSACARAVLVLLLLIPTQYGCGAIVRAARRAKTRSSNAKVRVMAWTKGRKNVYAGKDCESVLLDQYLKGKRKRGKKPGKSDWRNTSDRDQVLLAICSRSGSKDGGWQGGSGRELNPKQAHNEFDDQRYDPLRAALIIFWTASSDLEGTGKRTREFDSGLLQLDAWGGDAAVESALGLATMYAKTLDRDGLKARLAKLDLPADARATFVAAVNESAQRARRMLKETLKERDRKSKRGGHGALPVGDAMYLYQQLPTKVFKKRRQHFQRHAALFKELKAVKADLVSARRGGDDLKGLVAKLQKLRSRFMKRCGEQRCVATPLYLAITKELLVSHIQKQAHVDAKVEGPIYKANGSANATLPGNIYAKQRQSFVRTCTANKLYRRALKKGADKETAMALTGGVAPYCPRSFTLHDPKLKSRNLAKLLKGRVRNGDGIVDKVKKKGRMARVVFRKFKHTQWQSYGCKETNKIDRWDPWTKKFVYRVKCKGSKKIHYTSQAAPVSIPSSEVGGIRGGDRLYFLCDYDSRDDCRVRSVERGAEGARNVVQLRADKIKPAPSPNNRKGR